MHHRSSLIFAVLVILAYAWPVQGQVTVTPTFAYVENHRPGSIRVINQSDQVQEMAVNFQFGYPTSDSLGRRFIQYDDPQAAARYAVTSWIKSFPQKFVLPPGEQQVVRFMIRPPEDLTDGLYWTRVVVSSQRQPASTPRALADAASAQLNVTVKQAFPLVYRRGSATTEVQIKDVRTSIKEQQVKVAAHIERIGNAPFLGTAQLKVFDETGRLVATKQRTSSVYFDYAEVFPLDRNVLPPGQYTAELTLTGERRDLAQYTLPSMSPVVKTWDFEIRSDEAVETSEVATVSDSDGK